MKSKKFILVKPYNSTQLAELYGVSTMTFYRWMKPFKSQLGKRIGYYYQVRQVEKIFGLLGVPYSLEE